MKKLNALALIIAALFLTSCFEDSDDVAVTANDINDFVWKGMNVFYLYKDNVPNLANNRFSSNAEYADYLSEFNTPSDLFESLIYQQNTIDKFSWITDNYFANEDLLNGIGTVNGMQFTTIRRSDTDPVRYGIVLYVMPGSDASSQGVKRGDIFYAIDGTELYYNSSTDNNYSLFNQNSYTINLGTYETNGTPQLDDDSVTPNGQSIELTKQTFTENPIHLSKVLSISGKSIGYLMYNSFNGESEALNNVFATFKNQGISDLVVDLRYNSGGFNSKAVLLSSLITGQFTGDVLSKRFYNSEIQELYENQAPELLTDNFISSESGMTLNSLNLNKVYILTSGSSASASELVINGLSPYINVIQIGTNTRGKYQGSRTIYDSENFGREGANPNHTYALQPLIFKYANVDNETDFIDGLEPDITVNESRLNLGILGDENEPLLAEAIQNITGSGKSNNQKNNNIYIKETFGDLNSTEGKLIDDSSMPANIIKAMLFD